MSIAQAPLPGVAMAYGRTMVKLSLTVSGPEPTASVLPFQQESCRSMTATPGGEWPASTCSMMRGLWEGRSAGAAAQHDRHGHDQGGPPGDRLEGADVGAEVDGRLGPSKAG